MTWPLTRSRFKRERNSGLGGEKSIVADSDLGRHDHDWACLVSFFGDLHPDRDINNLCGGYADINTVPSESGSLHVVGHNDGIVHVR